MQPSGPLLLASLSTDFKIADASVACLPAASGTGCCLLSKRECIWAARVTWRSADPLALSLPFSAVLAGEAAACCVSLALAWSILRQSESLSVYEPCGLQGLPPERRSCSILPRVGWSVSGGVGGEGTL
jgi:hypothetical protein